MIPLFLSTVLMGAFAIVVRYGQRRGGDTTAIGAVNYVVASVCFVPLLVITSGLDISRRTWLIGIIGGILYSSAYFLIPPMLKAKGVAVTTALMRISVIIPVLMSLVLWQETPTGVQTIGAILALVALPMLAAGSATDGNGQSTKWTALALAGLFILTGACAAVNKVYHILGTPGERPAFLLILFAVAAIEAGLIWAFVSRRLSGVDLRVGVFLGLVNAGANTAMLSALDAYSGVVVFPVTAAGGLVFAFAFAAFVWGEKPTRWGMAGVVLALVAVLLVNISASKEQAVYQPPVVPTSLSHSSPFGSPDSPGGLGGQQGDPAMTDMTDVTKLWDVERIASEDLRIETLRERQIGWGANRISTRDIRYYSHDWAEGEVIIAAHIALPTADAPVPAVVMGTGDADSADTFCRQHGVAAIAIDRPGTGESTGPEDLYSNWVNFTDPRDGWMYHYVTSAMRAVTLATALPEVDPARIGITGYSRGGTMAWIAGGVDPRLALAIPIATGGDIVLALDHGGWANYIHRDEQGQTHIPDEFYTFAKYYDPMLYCGRQHGSVLLVVGAQDEYFPLYCTKTSAEASGDDDFRMLIVANWDHGYFAGDNPHVDAFDNRSEAKAKELRAVTAAINSRLKTQGDLPEAPRLTVSRDGDALLFSVEATGVESATVQVSVDGAYTLTELPATPDGDAFVAELAGPDSAVLDGAAAYAEVYSSDGPVLTSIPWFGPAFEQRMRAYPEPDED